MGTLYSFFAEALAYGIRVEFSQAGVTCHVILRVPGHEGARFLIPWSVIREMKEVYENR